MIVVFLQFPQVYGVRSALQVSSSSDHREMQTMQSMMQAQHSALLAEVASRDVRIHHLSQESGHANHVLTSSVKQMQSDVSTQKREAEEVSTVTKSCLLNCHIVIHVWRMKMPSALEEW
jgi:N-dimethylarginine dimethylaminohydrolase